jgi:hypothetical protein
MMNPTPVTPSDSSCAFAGYTGCCDHEFWLSAFTGSDMLLSSLHHLEWVSFELPLSLRMKQP